MITWIFTKKIRTKKTKYHIVDSTPLPVCNNQYRYLAKVFKGLASAGKNLNGWFWGFKLHLIVNDSLEIEAIKITDGSTSDVQVLEGDFIEGIKGWLVGDMGYMSPRKKRELTKKNITLLTKTRKNMKKYPATKLQNYFLSKRQAIESVFSTLKHRLLILNRYARSAEGFFVNVFVALTSYIFDKKSERTPFLEPSLISLIS